MTEETEKDEVLWVTVSGTPTQEVMDNIVSEIDDTVLGDRYQIIATLEDISTVEADEIRDMFCEE